MNPLLLRLLVQLRLIGPDRLRLVVNEDRYFVDAPLIVEATSGERVEVVFRVDSGCSTSVMSMERAQRFNLPLQGERTRHWIHTAAGRREVESIHGEFRFWLAADQWAAPFVSPIRFEENRPSGVPNLLGLKGVIDQIRWLIDGRYLSEDEPNGFCILQDHRPAARRYPS